MNIPFRAVEAFLSDQESGMSRNTPIAVLAGVSLGSYRRNAWRPTRPGWCICVLPSQRHGRGNLREIWTRVLEFGNECAEGTDAGVHFLLAHDREDERPKYRRDLRTRSLRAVWLDRRLSTQYGSTDFRRAIDNCLAFEEQWRQYLRPTLNSPLLLPESAFEADANVRDTWRRVQDVMVGHDNIGGGTRIGEKIPSRTRERFGMESTHAGCCSGEGYSMACTAYQLGVGKSWDSRCQVGFISM